MLYFLDFYLVFLENEAASKPDGAALAGAARFACAKQEVTLSSMRRGAGK